MHGFLMQTGTDPQPSSWARTNAEPGFVVIRPGCNFMPPPHVGFLVFPLFPLSCRSAHAHGSITYLVNPDAPRKSHAAYLDNRYPRPWRARLVTVASLFRCTKSEFNLSMARR